MMMLLSSSRDMSLSCIRGRVPLSSRIQIQLIHI